MTVFNGELYAGAGSDTNGFSIWRSATGDSGSWTSVVTGGFGDLNNHGVTGFATFNGYFYAAIEDKPSGSARVLRSSDGSTWDWASPPGLGDTTNDQTGGFAIFNGFLYIGTNNLATGGQVWNTNNGTNWTQVLGNGFGDLNNYKVESLYTYGGYLHAGADNGVTGVEIWRSSDGSTWQQVNPNGFGLSTNSGLLWSSSVTTFNNQLYYGIGGNAGVQVWQMLRQIFLPLVIH